ncbi:MAG: tetratricopeptide repeat protein [Spirochaetes bacterium]|nr:tetratricopeptide repeat protein [Spirochaetota bacterium]
MIEDVFFISMEGKKGFKINDFEVREDIALPILVLDKDHFSTEQINAENIISGMIKVLIEEPDNENIEYYRDFIYSVQPEIEYKLTRIAYEAERNYHFNDAIDIYKVLYSLKPDSNEHNLNLAVCYDEYSKYLYEQGRDREAEKFEDESHVFYRYLEEIEDKDDRILYYLGRFYLFRENYDKSIEYFNSFLKITEEEDRKKEVLDILEQITNSGLSDEDYHTAIGLIQSDKEKEAIEFIDKYIEKYPDSWNGYYVKGWALRKSQSYNDAIRFFEKALELNDNSADLFNELGLCYLNLNIFNKCERYFAKALRIKPEDTAIIYNLAICSVKKGDREEALKYCDVIKEFNPEDIHIENLKKIIEENDF